MLKAEVVGQTLKGMTSMETNYLAIFRFMTYQICTRTLHSFILNIYIAPLQENYSEALPTPARLNKAVLRWEKNAGKRVLLQMRSSEARPFQVEGPTTEKAQICLVEVQAKGTRRMEYNSHYSTAYSAIQPRSCLIKLKLFFLKSLPMMKSSSAIGTSK